VATLAIDYNDISLLDYLLTNTAELMLKVKQIDRATYFYNQLV